jgi:hypothetical protein
MTIIGLKFNERGVDVSDAKIQETWAKSVAAERAARETDLQAALVEELAPAQATNELLKALERAQARVQEREDEAMGRALHERMGGRDESK